LTLGSWDTSSELRASKDISRRFRLRLSALFSTAGRLRAATAAPQPIAPGAGQECREYRTTTTIDGQMQETVGTACRQADGRWRITN
jgi:hypothetical protein